MIDYASYPNQGNVDSVLSEAVGRADSTNEVLIPAIVRWFYNEAPSTCWGSPDRVRAWYDRFWSKADPE